MLCWLLKPATSVYLRSALSRQRVVNDISAIFNTCVPLRLMSLRKCHSTLFCAIWLSRFRCFRIWFAMDGYDTSSTLSSSESNEYLEYNSWNPMMELLCHAHIGVFMEAYLDEVDMGRIALSCHFSLNVLCDKTSSLPLVNGQVSVRTW